MKKLIYKILMLALIFNIVACMAKNESDSDQKIMATLANVPGRNYSSLSVHPNCEEILFIEFINNFPDVSRLMRYHLKKNELKYYDLPKDYVYLDVAFSPSGKNIVMRRAPNVRGDDEVKRNAYASSEIVTMKEDGSDLKVIPLASGLKMSPVMSHDDQHIAYWRATQRPQGSKSFAFRYDVWEVDLKTGIDKLFTLSYEFFQGGQIQYFLGDKKIIIGSDIPMSNNLPGLTENNWINWRTEYSNKNNNNYIYILNRGSQYYSNPLDLDPKFSNMPSLDNDQNLYFSGDFPMSSFFKKNSKGNIEQWRYPWSYLGQELEIFSLPNGSSIIFIFRYLNSPRSHRGIAIFDVLNKSWTQIKIPKIESAVPIFFN